MVAEWAANSLFNEVALLLVLAAAAGLVGLMLRQPLIVSFIAVGIVVGPAGLNLVMSAEPIDLLAELGIAVLLFLVGIKLDIGLIRTLGPVSVITGIGQMSFTSVFGYLLCQALGMDVITSIYIAIALTFSSTIIIVKMLSDKREIDSLHGRIALGLLIVQDLAVVMAMIALSAIGIGARHETGPGEVLLVLGYGLMMLVFVLAFVRYVATPLTERLARAPELLMGFAIALAVSFAAIGDGFGLGKELGGLMAGVALASTPFRDAIAARLAPLRDFLLLFFFIGLGAHLDPGNIGEIWLDALLLSLFVLIGKPFVVLLIAVALGYRRRTGALAGLTVAQISEFSLIFMAMGVTLGHVTGKELGLVTLVGLITIAASAYMITYTHPLYDRLEPFLRIFEGQAKRETADAIPGASENPAVIIFGLGRFGGAIGRRLAAKGHRVLGVDFSPVAVRRWQADGLNALYGDVSDPEFIATLPLAGAGWIISAIPHTRAGVNHADAAVVLIQALRELGFHGAIAVTGNPAADPQAFIRAGADRVLDPYQDAADRAVEIIETDACPIRIGLEPEEQKPIAT